MEKVDGKERSFRFSYYVDLPPHEKGQRLRVWIPRPMSHESQSFVVRRVDAPGTVEEATDRAFGNTGFYFEPPPSAEPQRAVFEYEITRKVRTSPPVDDYEDLDYKDSEDPDDPAFEPYLASNLNVPTDGFIGYQARSIASPAELPTVRAREVFDHLIDTLEYDWAGCTPDRIADLGDLKKACDLRTGTCTEWHGLYVGYLRALGVPAQFCFGFNVPHYKPSGEIPGYHCWADVWLPRAGWVPVDVTEAWKDPENREFYFGSLDCHRVEFHAGRDLLLSPAQADSVVDKWIFGHAELDDKSFHLDVSFDFEDC